VPVVALFRPHALQHFAQVLLSAGACVCDPARRSAAVPVAALLRAKTAPRTPTFCSSSSFCWCLGALQAGALQCLVLLCLGPEGPLADLEASAEKREEAEEASRLLAKRVGVCGYGSLTTRYVLSVCGGMRE
jgi:hypothetical protein